METNLELPNRVVAEWKEIVRTEMDYNTKTSKATVYYYLDEQAFIDKKEPVMGEVINVPYKEQNEMEKVGVTSKTVAEEAMAVKMDEKPVLVEEVIE